MPGVSLNGDSAGVSAATRSSSFNCLMLNESHDGGTHTRNTHGGGTYTRNTHGGGTWTRSVHSRGSQSGLAENAKAPQRPDDLDALGKRESLGELVRHCCKRTRHARLDVSGERRDKRKRTDATSGEENRDMVME